jgi:mannose-6-phosphate isomerase-like protein (cupin superfamily)
LISRKDCPVPSKPYHVTLANTKTKRNRSEATALLMNRNFVQFVWADDPVHYRATYKQAPHRHDYEQLHIQTAGALEMMCDDQVYTLRAGDALYIPSGSLHTGFPLGEEPSGWMEVFGDVRWERMALAQHHLDFEGDPGVTK